MATGNDQIGLTVGVSSFFWFDEVDEWEQAETAQVEVKIISRDTSGKFPVQGLRSMEG